MAAGWPPKERGLQQVIGAEEALHALGRALEFIFS
jgi:hypothetical protein